MKWLTVVALKIALGVVIVILNLAVVAICLSFGIDSFGLHVIGSYESTEALRRHLSLLYLPALTLAVLLPAFVPMATSVRHPWLARCFVLLVVTEGLLLWCLCFVKTLGRAFRTYPMGDKASLPTVESVYEGLTWFETPFLAPILWLVDHEFGLLAILFYNLAWGTAVTLCGYLAWRAYRRFRGANGADGRS